MDLDFFILASIASLLLRSGIIMFARGVRGGHI